jgi:uncharacterized YccA/Bax inhibitor family protein
MYTSSLFGSGLPALPVLQECIGWQVYKVTSAPHLSMVASACFALGGIIVILVSSHLKKKRSSEATVLPQTVRLEKIGNETGQFRSFVDEDE